MSRARQALCLGIVLAVALGLGYAGWRVTRSPESSVCRVCGRMIHADMRTVAVVGDKREVFCCPTCALSAGAQLHKAVRFEQLSDYETGHPLLPANAFAVEGSDVITCVHSQQMLDHDGQPIPMAYDRCSPSIIAFANRTSAERFASEHGGQIGAFLRLTAAPAVATPQ